MSKRLATQIIQTLHTQGFEAYLAGGCVRDELLGVEPKDFDIATNASPEAIQKIFKKTVPVGVQFGVVLVVEEGKTFEVATFRNDGQYEDGRRPTSISFGTLEEDAMRRDFTVNGLYWDLKQNKVIDLVGGEKDLKAKIIRSIGEPKKRFEEDHLRMFRAIRFSVQLGFEMDPAIPTLIKTHAGWLNKISKERIRDELTKTLTSQNPARGIRLLDECGLLETFLPEIEKLKKVEQPPEYHPEGDVYIHTLMLLEGLSQAPIELALGCLLHDIAKPNTFVRATDRIRFHGHDKLGAEMTIDICKRLAFSNDETKLISELVREHLRFKDAFQMRQSTLKRFLSIDRFDLHLELHRLDCLASHKNLDAYEFCKNKWEEMKKMPPPPLRLINGDDLIQMGFSPGPEIGKIIRSVEDAILEGEVHTKEEALQYVRSHFGGNHGSS